MPAASPCTRAARAHRGPRRGVAPDAPQRKRWTAPPQSHVLFAGIAGNVCDMAKTPACTVHVLVDVSCAVHSPTRPRSLTAAGARLFAVPASQTARVAGRSLSRSLPLFATDAPTRQASPARLLQWQAGASGCSLHTIHPASTHTGSFSPTRPPGAARYTTHSVRGRSGTGALRRHSLHARVTTARAGFPSRKRPPAPPFGRLRPPYA